MCNDTQRHANRRKDVQTKKLRPKLYFLSGVDICKDVQRYANIRKDVQRCANIRKDMQKCEKVKLLHKFSYHCIEFGGRTLEVRFPHF
jgi:hypothetical protein